MSFYLWNGLGSWAFHEATWDPKYPVAPRKQDNSLATTMDLPVEVIQHIFYFLSPREILRLRQVSKQFLDITRNLVLWKNIYASAGLLLPPGPFHSQSTRHLESTLVQSELLSKTWTSQPLKVLRQTEISWKRPKLGGGHTVAFGRWCIFLEGRTIQCHDIDTDTRHSLYDATADPIFWFSACTTAYGNGQWIHLLLVGEHQNTLLRLLAFRVNDDGFLGSEPEIMDWTHLGSQLTCRWRLTEGHPVFHGSTPFVVVQHSRPYLVLDLRTGCLYRLLRNESRVFAPTLHPRNLTLSAHIVLTKTHVIAFWVYTPSLDMPVLIQAFVAPGPDPPRDKKDIFELCLTHEVEFARDSLQSVTLLRNSVVNPVTGSVNIRLLRTTLTNTSCLDLTLPRRVSTTDVLPISIRTQHLLEIQWSFIRYTASDDGHVRGFLLPYSAYTARKFAIDASGEECIMTVGDPYPTYPHLHEAAFCGMRGRVHFFDPKNRLDQTRITVLTIDFI